VRSADRDKLVSSKRVDSVTIKYRDMKCDEGIAVWFHAFLKLALYEKKTGQLKVAAAFISQ
jgi:hypothetical protein